MLRKQEAYKKRVLVGDVFALLFDERFVFGQVVGSNLPFAGFDKCQHKVVIFLQTAEKRVDWRISLDSGLLIPPQYINNLGFSRGYMPVIDHAPVVSYDGNAVCYMDFPGGYVDEHGVPCAARQLVSDYGFGNYLTLENQVEACIDRVRLPHSD